MNAAAFRSDPSQVLGAWTSFVSMSAEAVAPLPRIAWVLERNGG
jgi:hypothetical protein